MPYTMSEHLNYKVLHLTGEVDLHNSPELRKSILATLGGNSSLLVDFSGLSYIDSSGVATLVEGLNTARGKNLKFAIVGATAGPLQVLQLTRLDKVFDLRASLDEVTE